jgi:hypothetical protein
MHGAFYPFAVKIAAGKINVLTGAAWKDDLDPHVQDWVVADGKRRIDGFCVGKGTVRQFAAMPLGFGCSAEEQLTGAGIFGGVQIAVYPMRREAFLRRFPALPEKNDQGMEVVSDFGETPMSPVSDRPRRIWPVLERRTGRDPGMGLCPGGLVRQHVYSDPFDREDWDMENKNRCFTHIADSRFWKTITGQVLRHGPISAKEGQRAWVPWFEPVSGHPGVLFGSEAISGLKSHGMMNSSENTERPAMFLKKIGSCVRT